MRDALRLMEEREKRLKALDDMIYHSIAQADAGLGYDAEDVFAELEAKHAAKAERRK